MKFTNSMKVAGELAVRKMSDKARAFYNDTDQLVLYEHYDDEGVARYSVRGFVRFDDLTFDEMEHTFEEIHDALQLEIL